MATLVVKALDVSGSPLSGVAVLAKLTDLNGQPLHEFSLDGLLVQPVLSHTGSDGIATIELVPNEDIQRDNTYYTIHVGLEAPVLISKGSSEETLLASRVTSPIALGPAAILGDLADVDVSGLASGQALQWNGTKWVPVDWVEGGGGGGGAPAAHATSHITGSDVLSDATVSTHGLMTAADKVKVNGVASGATANSTDAQLRDRSTHTGTQANTTITGLGTASTQATSAFEAAGAVSTGISAHAAALDPHGDRAYADAAVAALISAAPSLLNTLDEIAAALNDDPNFAATMTTLLAGKQAAHALLTQISGMTLTANDIIQYVGGVLTNRTMAQLKTALALAKADVGLSNVDNTADASKPISTATQTALDLKAAKLAVVRLITTTSDTPVLGDAQNGMETNNSSPVAITIPLNASVAYPLQTEMWWTQIGTGQITIGIAGGGTLRTPGGAKSRAQWSTIGARQRAANEWVVYGDTAV